MTGAPAVPLPAHHQHTQHFQHFPLYSHTLSNPRNEYYFFFNMLICLNFAVKYISGKDDVQKFVSLLQKKKTIS